jgi:hypothetical protein
VIAVAEAAGLRPRDPWVRAIAAVAPARVPKPIAAVQ